MSDTHANDMATLLPDREITIAGVAVTVREIRFAQTAEAMQLMAPVIEALRSLELDPDAPELAIGPLEALVNAHWEAFRRFMALATGRPQAWIDDLPDQAGQELALTVLAVNAGFFLRRLAAHRPAPAPTADAPGLSTSSQSSSPTASDQTPPTSRAH